MLISGPIDLVRDLLLGEEIRFSEGRTFHGLSLIPVLLARPRAAEPSYLLFDEALRHRLVTIEEIGMGTVPRLRASNAADRPVLLIDGEQLVGAKQNRVLNTTLLLPPRSTLEIPVACVEQGRWSITTREFAASDLPLFPRARAAKAVAVTRSVRSTGSFEADQAEIWDHVAEKLAEASVVAPSAAYAEAGRSRSGDLDAFLREFAWSEGQVGVLCGVGERVLCLDLFDHPETLRKLYPRLVRSYAIDVLGRDVQGSIAVSAARDFVLSAAKARATDHESVGLGREVRLEAADIVGAALVTDHVVHLAVFARDDRPMPIYEREGISSQPVTPPSHRRGMH